MDKGLAEQGSERAEGGYDGWMGPKLQNRGGGVDRALTSRCAFGPRIPFGWPSALQRVCAQAGEFVVPAAFQGPACWSIAFRPVRCPSLASFEAVFSTERRLTGLLTLQLINVPSSTVSAAARSPNSKCPEPGRLKRTAAGNAVMRRPPKTRLRRPLLRNCHSTYLCSRVSCRQPTTLVAEREKAVGLLGLCLGQWQSGSS